MLAGESSVGTEQYTFIEIEGQDQLTVPYRLAPERCGLTPKFCGAVLTLRVIRLNRLRPRNLLDYFRCLLRLIAADSYIGLRDHSDQSTVVIDHRNASHLMLLHRIESDLQVVVRATRQGLSRHYILHPCAAGIAVLGDRL